MSPPIPMYPTSTVTRTKHSGFPTHQQPNIAHRLLPQPGTSYHPFNPSLIPMPGPSTHHPYANSRQVWPINLALQHAGPNAPQSPLLYPSLPFPTPPPTHSKSEAYCDISPYPNGLLTSSMGSTLIQTLSGSELRKSSTNYPHIPAIAHSHTT